MTKEEKAFLDMIAYSEGTLGVSQEYDVGFGTPPKKIVGWTPDTKITHGGISWGAVGRYQFRYTTWCELNGSSVKPINAAMNVTNQNNSGVKLMNLKIGNLDKSKFSNINNFTAAINLLNKTWTSFTSHNLNELHDIYLKALSLY